jgi:hypothetical protein
MRAARYRQCPPDCPRALVEKMGSDILTKVERRWPRRRHELGPCLVWTGGRPNLPARFNVVRTDPQPPTHARSRTLRCAGPTAWCTASGVGPASISAYPRASWLGAARASKRATLEELSLSVLQPAERVI